MMDGVVPSQLFGASFVIANAVMIGSIFLQLLVYLAVAANRYTAIRHPMKHRSV